MQEIIDSDINQPKPSDSKSIFTRIKALWDNKVAIVITIGSLGFVLGSYYKETLMLNAQTKELINLTNNWKEQELSYFSTIDALKSEIDELKNDRLELKSTIYELNFAIRHGKEK